MPTRLALLKRYAKAHWHQKKKQGPQPTTNNKQQKK
jgi:hypothetical protein